VSRCDEALLCRGGCPWAPPLAIVCIQSRHPWLRTDRLFLNAYAAGGTCAPSRRCPGPPTGCTPSGAIHGHTGRQHPPLRACAFRAYGRRRSRSSVLRPQAPPSAPALRARPCAAPAVPALPALDQLPGLVLGLRARPGAGPEALRFTAPQCCAWPNRAGGAGTEPQGSDLAAARAGSRAEAGPISRGPCRAYQGSSAQGTDPSHPNARLRRDGGLICIYTRRAKRAPKPDCSQGRLIC
jgi:hypothetical protein